MKLERIREEGKLRKLLNEEQKAIYPFLFPLQLEKWIREEEEPYAPLTYVLLNEQEIIGGSVVRIQDFIDRSRIILELDAFWIREDCRGKGIGTQFLQEILQICYSYYQKFGLEPEAMIIETVTAKMFYQKALKRIQKQLQIEFKEVHLGKIDVFVVSFKRDF